MGENEPMPNYIDFPPEERQIRRIEGGQIMNRNNVRDEIRASLCQRGLLG